jgi:KaiC/GvpD/RAD55 family RecA-like ATPase
MTIYRCILAKWDEERHPEKRRVYEGEFTQERLNQLNADGYNIYYLPNYPSAYELGVKVDGSMVDKFEYIFVDFDIKDGVYPDKDTFLQVVGNSYISPTKIVDSGNGIHVYWAVSDLDAMGYLKLTRRIMRLFNTDSAVGQLYQLMRAPGSVNVKDETNPKLCELIYSDEISYTCEQMDKLLPPLTQADALHCQQHYDKTYGLNQEIAISDALPAKFSDFLRNNKEVKDIWSGEVEDRSKGDYRLGHLMYSAGFTRQEALSVLINTSKAKDRAPQHRLSYATGIVDKIFEFEKAVDKAEVGLSSSVRDILEKSGDSLKGTRFPCWSYLDATHAGMRLGQVIGLIAGSGVGKTALALEMFYGFVQNNPDYIHLFIPLEQPAREIAERWKLRCGDQTHLHDRVHVMSNYDADGGYRHLSFDEIKNYILDFQKKSGKKVGCVVIDHIGALRKNGGKMGENQDLVDICHSMKAFAVQTDTMLIMQSQAPREKAGIGDLELNKDAAYGTVFFESYCDFVITMWQPLKRCYGEPDCPTVTAFKFCKIRDKHREKDKIQEDVCYTLKFDPNRESFAEMTQVDMTRLDFWVKKATNIRKKDRKTDLVTYTHIDWAGNKNGAASHNQNSQ